MIIGEFIHHLIEQEQYFHFTGINEVASLDCPGLQQSTLKIRLLNKSKFGLIYLLVDHRGGQWLSVPNTCSLYSDSLSISKLETWTLANTSIYRKYYEMSDLHIEDTSISNASLHVQTEIAREIERNLGRNYRPPFKDFWKMLVFDITLIYFLFYQIFFRSSKWLWETIWVKVEGLFTKVNILFEDISNFHGQLWAFLCLLILGIYILLYIKSKMCGRRGGPEPL